MFDVTLNDPLALKKLVDVIAIGCGKITAPYLTKKNAQAKAFETLTIANAQAEALEKTAGFLKKISYNDTKVAMETLDMGSREVGLEQRALHRKTYQEIIRQMNIEAINQVAFQELVKERVVSPDPVDSSWISRFFDIASEVSEEGLRLLWGKILAGEVEQPGSFSLRTLEVFKNLTKREAEVFLKFAERAFWYDKEAVLFDFSANSQPLQTPFKIPVLERLLMEESGLLSTSDTLAFSLGPTTIKEKIYFFVSGDQGLRFKLLQNSPEIEVPVFRFTIAGSQLLKLVSKSSSQIHLEEVGCALKSEQVIISTGLVTMKDGEVSSFELIKDI